MHDQTPQPAKVVEPDVVGLHPGRLEVQRCCCPRDETDRGVADADHPVAEDALERFGDHAGRVGEVDDVRPRRQCTDPLADAEHLGDGAKSVRDAARTRGLLAEQAKLEGDAFVPHAPLQSADPDGCEDEVGVLERTVEVGGHLHPWRFGPREPSGSRGAVRRQLVEDRGDDGQAFRRLVVERHRVDAWRTGLAEQGRVDERDSEASSADDCQLHGAFTRPDRWSRCRWRSTPVRPARRR